MESCMLLRRNLLLFLTVSGKVINGVGSGGAGGVQAHLQTFFDLSKILAKMAPNVWLLFSKTKEKHIENFSWGHINKREIRAKIFRTPKICLLLPLWQSCSMCSPPWLVPCYSEEVNVGKISSRVLRKIQMTRFRCFLPNVYLSGTISCFASSGRPTL